MQIRRDALRTLEAFIIGLFTIQTVRFLYAALYADISSADLARRVRDTSAFENLPGYIESATVQQEINAALIAVLVPLLGLLLYRLRWSIPLAVAVCVTAREIVVETPQSNLLAAATVVGAGLLYLTLIAIRRPRFVPIMIATGVAGDQIIRAYHSTADPTFDPSFVVSLFGFGIEIDEFLLGVAIFTTLLSAITLIIEREEERLPQYVKQPRGVLTVWGAIALGGLLFLQLTVLGLPNAAARWANVEYDLMLPLILMATLLPLVPEVRAQAGNFLSIFDGTYRGWLWGLMLALFLIIGRRFDGYVGAAVLTLAQFFSILTLWWMVRQPEKSPRLNPTPVTILMSIVVVGVLAIGDYFTYDYAYVRPLAAPFESVSDLLANLRDFGLPLAILAAILACMPIILERQIIPWRQGKILETLVSLLAVVLIVVNTTGAAVAEPVRRPVVPECLRIASYNLHGGYTQFFAPNLEQVAQTIERSGADIVLLQEVDAGLLRSGSTDQVRWLADRLNMNATFYPQTEALQGIAVLSRLDVSSESGARLTSPGAPAAVQYVTYRLDNTSDLHVYNAWLSLEVAERNGQPVPLNAQDYVLQQEEVYRLVASNHFDPASTAQDRVILGGTFNYDESSPLYDRWAETVFEDPFIGLFDETRNTLYAVEQPGVRYDYIWLLNLDIRGFQIDQRSIYSDHRLSLVVVGLQDGQNCTG